MSKTYKNNAGHTILGIEPGQTGTLDDATGCVGPDALEAVGESKPEPKPDAPDLKPLKVFRIEAPEAQPDADSD